MNNIFFKKINLPAAVDSTVFAELSLKFFSRSIGGDVMHVTVVIPDSKNYCDEELRKREIAKKNNKKSQKKKKK